MNIILKCINFGCFISYGNEINLTKTQKIVCFAFVCFGLRRVKLRKIYFNAILLNTIFMSQVIWHYRHGTIMILETEVYNVVALCYQS